MQNTIIKAKEMLNNRQFLQAFGRNAYICSMIRKMLLLTALVVAMTARAQDAVLPDTTLHLPTLNSLGQMRYISRWPMMGSTFMGFQNWDLHQGLNISMGTSVFAAFGKHAPSGAGFAQNFSGMYAVPLSDKLSLAFGGYLVNADWAGSHLRDAGVSTVLGYQFNEKWEGYLYGQKSLVQPQMAWPLYPMHEMGDRIGASIKHNFSPSFSIQLSVEQRTTPTREIEGEKRPPVFPRR